MYFFAHAGILSSVERPLSALLLSLVERPIFKGGFFMFALLRRRNFALFWLGQTVSLMGDYTLAIALPFYVLQLTGSILQTGLMFIIETIPSILFGTLAGVFVDRWGRRRTMILCNLLQAGTLFLLLVVRSPRLIWVVYLVALLQAHSSLHWSRKSSWREQTRWNLSVIRSRVSPDCL
jgi:Na+/melibiose symporter-like transporter